MILSQINAPYFFKNAMHTHYFKKLPHLLYYFLMIYGIVIDEHIQLPLNSRY